MPPPPTPSAPLLERASSHTTTNPKERMSAYVKKVLPILVWLPNYLDMHLEHSTTGEVVKQSWVTAKLIPDLLGGVLLGCILEAQSLAHASLCGVDLIHGPYSCILPPMLYVWFGTAVHSSIGTGGLVSLLTGDQLARIDDTVEGRTQACAILTLEVGVLMALMAVLNLGSFVRFISKPVLSGFVTASALLIIASQVGPMLDLPEAERKEGLWNTLVYHQSNLSHANKATLCLSVVALLWLMNAKRFKGFKKFPSLKYLNDFKELVLLVVGAYVARQYNKSTDRIIPVVGEVPLGLPGLSFPIKTAADFEQAKNLLPAATLVALVVFLSSFAGAKKFGLMDGYQVRAFNELLGLGFANVGGAFMGAVPTQVGLSRMGIARGAGIKTQLGANFFVGIVVALITGFFSQYLYSIPRCLLNAIIVNGAMHLTEFSEAKRLFAFSKVKDYGLKMRMELLVWVVGLVCTLWLGALKGMCVAVITSILLIMAQVSDPKITALGYDPQSITALGDTKTRRPRKWVDKKRHSNVLEEHSIFVFRLEGPLFFANVDRLQEWLEEEEVQSVVTKGEEAGAFYGIIFSAGAVSFMDTTAVEALKKMISSYKARNIPFFFANTFGQVGRMITRELEPLMTEGMGKLTPLVHKCSSIDDFVTLIRDYMTMVDEGQEVEENDSTKLFTPGGHRLSVLPLKRTVSGVLNPMPEA